MGLFDLVEGKLSPHLIPQSLMHHTMTEISKTLITKYKGYSLVFNHPDEVYRNVDTIFARQKNTLFVSVKFPVSSFNKPLSLFKILSFPVPINSTANHAIQLLDLPKYFAITDDLQYYAFFDSEGLERCKTGKLILCGSSKQLHPITFESCISALFKNDKTVVKTKCNFRFIPYHLSPSIIPVSHTSILLYNTDVVEFDCKTGKRMQKGCKFCLVQVPCECSVSTSTIYLPPRLSACHENTTSVLHPVNLALLQHFFNDKELKDIDANALFENPLSVEVPHFKIYNHSMQTIIPDDRKAHLSLEKMAQSAKKNAIVFQSMTDPLLTGDILMNDNWPSSDDILLYCTTGVAGFCLFALMLTIIKLRKVLIILSVLKTTNVKEVQAATLPSFVYNKPTATEEPLNYFWDELDLTYDHYILTIVSITMLLVIVIFVKTFRRKGSNTEILVEITNGLSCVHIPLHSLSMCPSYCPIECVFNNCTRAVEFQGHVHMG